ncbi:tetratricopeptide repeat protein [bacterium]|nr:tetratricopeptide repeat protein [bacterium]
MAKRLSKNIRETAVLQDINLCYFEYYYTVRDIENAYKYLDFSREIGKISNLSVADIEYYNNLATLKLYEKEYEDALKYSEFAIKLSKESGEEISTTTYLNLASEYYYLSRLKKSEKTYLTCEKLAKERNELQVLGNIYNHLGALYNYNKDFPMALKYLNKSAGIRKDISDIRGLLFTMNSIAVMYISHKKLLKAKKVLKKMLPYTNKLNDVYLLSIYYFNFSKTELLLENYRPAFKYVKKSLEMCHIMGSEYDIAYTNVLYGFLRFVFHGNLEENIKLYESSKEMAITKKDDYLLLLINFYKVYMLFLAGKLKESRKYFKELNKIYNGFNGKYYKEEMLILRSLIYQNDKNSKKDMQESIAENEKNNNIFYVRKLKKYYNKYLQEQKNEDKADV